MVRFTLAVAEALDMSESKVRELLDVAELPEEVKEEIKQGKDTKSRNKKAKDPSFAPQQRRGLELLYRL